MTPVRTRYYYNAVQWLKWLLGSAMFLSLSVRCVAQQEMLAGYQPITQITDLAAIDLDQKKIRERAIVYDFRSAVRVYEDGGYSGSYALLNLIDPPANQSFRKGTLVMAFTSSGGDASGTLMEDVSWGTLNAGDTVPVKVRYTVQNVQSKYVECQVGALFHFGEANRKGCFAQTGTVFFIPLGVAVMKSFQKFNYEYDERRDNENALSIQSFSTQAADDMRNGNGEYYADFQLFFDYYGDTDYADKWVKAAADGSDTAFSNGRGDADFSGMTGTNARGRAEAMAKGTAYLNVWMAVIREMEHAVECCKFKCDSTDLKGCNNDALQALDRAVALYAGSLEGKSGSGDGEVLYALADKHAAQFKTAGYKGVEASGTAFVNLVIIDYWFNAMQKALLSKNPDGSGQCDVVQEGKDEIATLMLVPIVQGVLQYAWLRDIAPKNNAVEYEAAGATFTAALLPYLHNCKRTTASTLLDMMGMGSTNVQFSRVKKTLESAYPCLGITCAQVGGIWNGEQFPEHAGPCTDDLDIVDLAQYVGE